MKNLFTAKNQSSKKPVVQDDTPLFVYIVSSILLAALGLGLFMGLLYWTGEISWALAGVILAIILYYYVIQLLVKNKQEMFKNTFFNYTLVFWAFFGVLFIISTYIFSHFLNVETNAKPQIEASAFGKIELVEKLVETYRERGDDALQDYDSNLKRLLTQYKDLGNNSVRQILEQPPYSMDARTLNNRSGLDVQQVARAHMSAYLTNFENDFKNDSTMKGAMVTIKYTANELKQTFINWNRLSLIRDYSTLNDFVEKSLGIINKRVELLPIDNQAIEVEYDRSQLPLNDPKQMFVKYNFNWIVPIVVSLLIHLFLLLPFYMKRIREYGNKGVNPGQKSELTIEI